jgi:hypothetical protein
VKPVKKDKGASLYCRKKREEKMIELVPKDGLIMEKQKLG